MRDLRVVHGWRRECRKPRIQSAGLIRLSEMRVSSIRDSPRGSAVLNSFARQFVGLGIYGCFLTFVTRKCKNGVVGCQSSKYHARNQTPALFNHFPESSVVLVNYCF